MEASFSPLCLARNEDIVFSRFLSSLVAKAILRVCWQDLGAVTSPTDSNWHSLICTQDNGPINGIKFEYKHGNAEELYNRRRT